ncbi:MAG: c-type cytochrome [Proteobacteria bacterium]|nr:MAG: c-type cytochrome [Pseudomonadota bacterium]
MDEKNHAHTNADQGHHPLVPLKVYAMTLAALLVLTIVTVGASYLNFGSTANVLVSLGIASAKASLVLMFFMGLKYDSNLNRAFIMSSFAALILLLAVTAADLWTRPQPQPVKVVSAAVALSQEDFEKALGTSTPEAVAKGKEVYDVNCAVCHGAGGNGDGIGGAALNPKPRNFHAAAGEWKNGPSAKSIYVTLVYGIPGGGMASYKALPSSDRIALVHYVRSMGGHTDATAKADDRIAEAMKEDGIGGAGSGPVKMLLPIDFAIERTLNN